MLLVLFAIFVFAVVAAVIVARVREEDTGAARLGVLTACVVGGAVGVHGSDTSTAVEVVASLVAAAFVALTAYAAWRGRQRPAS